MVRVPNGDQFWLRSPVQYQHFCIKQLFSLKSVLRVGVGDSQCEHAIRECDVFLSVDFHFSSHDKYASFIVKSHIS